MTKIVTKQNEHFRNVLEVFIDKRYPNRYLGQFCKLSDGLWYLYPEVKAFNGCKEAGFFQAIADKMDELNATVSGLRNNNTQQGESV